MTEILLIVTLNNVTLPYLILSPFVVKLTELPEDSESECPVDASDSVDRRTWLHVPSGTHWSTSSDTHQVVEI